MQDLESAAPLDLNELSGRRRAPREAKWAADICVVISEFLVKYTGAQRPKMVNGCFGNWFQRDMPHWCSVINFCDASLLYSDAEAEKLRCRQVRKSPENNCCFNIPTHVA